MNPARPFCGNRHTHIQDRPVGQFRSLARVVTRGTDRHQQTDPPIEFAFKHRDRGSHKLLITLLHRCQIRPHRFRGQRYTTVMARVPQRFVNEVLWSEFEQQDQTLATFLDEVTDRVIAQGIDSDAAEVEVAQAEGL